MLEFFALSGITGGPKFDGFSGLSLVALVGGVVALIAWFILFAYRWWRTFPKMPDAGPETSDLGEEPPAIVNLLANRWKVTQSAIPATLIDLAARRVLAIDLVAGDEYVVRIRDGDQTKEKLTDYERQVLELVKERATGGSCPAKALDLGEEDQAKGFVKRFKKRVVSDAKSRGLARNRWQAHDFAIIGIGLAIALGLFASSFALAHLFEDTGGSSSGSDQWSRTDWFYAAGCAWLAAMFAVTRTQAIRETTLGKTACARWLGVRNYFRHNHAFDHAQVASVVIWERNLSYGVALGAAYQAAHEIPLAPDDPDEAWSREGGMWRQVRVEYPRGFGYGEAPGHVLLGGLGRMALWGGLCFVVLPVLLNIAYGIASDVLDSGADATPQERNVFFGIVLGFAVFASIAAVYLFVRFFAGVIRTWRAIGDLNKAVTVEGQVVKMHQGRAAVDDGHREELDAFAIGAIHAARGDHVRVTMTPHLHFVKQCDVLQAAPKSADEIAEDAAVRQPEMASVFAPVAMPNLDAAVQTAAGAAFVRSNELDDQLGAFGRGGAVQTFSDGNGSVVAVAAISMADSGPMGAMMGFVAKRLASARQNADGSDANTLWMHETDLIIRHGSGITVVHCDLKGKSPQDRRQVAEEIAAALGSGVDTGPAAPGDRSVTFAWPAPAELRP